jgi:class 3 adenylate cyclase
MEQRLPRKLAAILYADVAGYSRLTGDDEDATHRTLSEYLDLVSSIIENHRGQIMHYAGDAVLARFDAVLDALTSAVAVQTELSSRNESLPDERRVRFRIGVNLGDVIEDRGDIYGDGVNVAARLEALAEPGGICVSDAVREEPVRAYRVFENGAPPTPNSGRVGVDVPEGSLPLGKPSIAIKPFENLSGDRAQDHFADGLSNGVIVALTKVPGLVLIGDDSPGLQDSKQMTVEEVSRRFDVRYVLKGGVRKYGNRLRVNAELLNLPTRRYVWADNFDREFRDFGDFFDIQDEISEEVVTALDVKLLSGEAARLVRKSFTNSKALESYARGEDLLWIATTKPEIREVQRLFEEAISLEPDSPTGYAVAAVAYWAEVLCGLSDSPAHSMARAVELAGEAIERKDVTGYPHLILAHVHLEKREYDNAIAEASLAVTDRPSCPAAYSLKANVLNYLGRPADAVELAEYATRLSPLRPPTYATVLPSAYFALGRYDEAIAAARSAIELDQRNVELHLILAASSAAMNRTEEASQAARTVLALKPGFSLVEFEKSQPYKEHKSLEDLVTKLRGAGLT